ncbi:phosphate ABC transporter substrate-binding protein, PhoT family [Myroides marinus]|uniref:Phosphate ABC transporter substrate-binding protein, PhoT family n=1 Tax=Myroides marinus TaxID=703342 RepID=A0A163XQ66_9FLAO|nr:substrate-binding domain-containing protein [Myroides marinus]KZE78266.1 phosphate ABC transporter substrate-binding protein, PhoT family [Myroides marinus]
MIRKGFKVFSYVLAFTALSSTFIGCNKKGNTVAENSVVDPSELEESPVSGYTKILVDESIYPIAEDVNTVFMYEYNRVKVDLLKLSEAEVLNQLLNDSIRIAIMSRELNADEIERFKGRVVPKMTHFATDAIVFVTSKTYNDSVIDYDLVLKNLQSKSANASDKTILVFDDINSSIVRSFKEKAKVEKFPTEYAYYAGDTEKALEYVSKNPNAIGIIGLNWLTQPSERISKVIDEVKVLGVKNYTDGKFYKASQNNIAEGTYPLTRKLYVIDNQGKSGLGVGFASFIAGYKGQRIILKSSLVPFKIPPRELNVRDEI